MTTDELYDEIIKLFQAYESRMMARFDRLDRKFCKHEHLDEDGICRNCGQDRRGI